MILRLPYRRYPAPHAPGGFFYAASLPVHVSGLNASALHSKRFDAIIDSGATSCSFHASIGRAIGLNVATGKAIETLGVAGPTRQYLHPIALHVPGGPVTTEAGFSDDLPIAGLLGMAGFFEHFRITFDPCLTVLRSGETSSRLKTFSLWIFLANSANKWFVRRVTRNLWRPKSLG